MFRQYAALMVLALFMAKGGASQEVGLDFQVSQDSTGGVGPCTVAAGINNYLVAWTDNSTGNSAGNAPAPQLLASVVTQSGVASVPFALSTSGNSVIPLTGQRIQAAFDGTANWLVVWAEADPDSTGKNTNYYLYGSLISAVTTGTVSVGGIIATGKIAPLTGNVAPYPLVTFNGTDFVVAWMDSPVGKNSGSQIYFTRITSTSGAAGTPSALPSASNKPNQALLFLTNQATNGDVLLLFRDNSETPTVTCASRITNQGIVRDSGGIGLFYASETSGGGYGYPIGAAFNNGAWRILSSFDQLQDSSIYCTTLSLEGNVTAPSGIFATMGVGPTGITGLDDYAAVVSGADCWLFLRNERVSNQQYHILAKRVGYDGTDLDPIPVLLDSATQGVLYGAVGAEDNAIAQFFVTWVDGRTGASKSAQATNIFGVMVQATAPGSGGTALVPQLIASPVSGLAPLAVTFTGTATGAYDSMSLAFGDGGSTTSYSITHTYKNKGIFLAQLTVNKASYYVYQSVIISVGTSTTVESVGLPVPSSAGMVAEMFISKATVSLNFTTTGEDTALIIGQIDPSALPTPPASLAGVSGSVALGTNTYPFTLDATGQYTSDFTQKPYYQFTISPTTGIFTFQDTFDNLQVDLSAYGATNYTITTPIIVNVPITVSVSAFTASATVGLSYKAKQNTSGTGQFIFSKKGELASGGLVISKFTASEKETKGGPVTHTFTVSGQLISPGGAKLQPAVSGTFTFGFGNYSISMPVGQFVSKGKSLKYTSKGSISGLQKFTVDVNTGIFSLQMVNVPAQGTGGSGMPVANVDNINYVDLNFSFQFDLSYQTLDAGKYIAIMRQNSSAKKWTLQK